MKVLFATTNKAKMKSYGTPLIKSGIELLSLSDLNIDIDVDENGNDVVENATIKAKAYYELSNIDTFAIDEGLYFEDVPDDIQPGTHVRRVGNKRLNDEEMITYYLDLVNKYGKNGILRGYFKKAVALIIDGEINTCEIKTYREFINKRSSVIREGYPLASIQYVDRYNKYKSELTDLENEEIKKEEQNDIIIFLLEKLNEKEKIKKLGK